MRLQYCDQVPVHLNERLLGLLILIQDQLGCDGTRHLRQLILYDNDLQHKQICPKKFHCVACAVLGVLDLQVQGILSAFPALNIDFYCYGEV